ncbi:hypothetical protein [Mangrovicoccus algicola]|uniref:Pectate lyase superfamily protein domain-containing protein n=1 Tax=Mangrovicoccus algicola TaxID=2771008 RepID=A0A8J6YWB8_9RHOB|nr:hypothetical protein [Mangrovicoccus algicola]MBE3638942.1 hypothetical protein [Mangrovicoccus algicola]
MTQEITSSEFEAELGAAPGPKQNLVELEVGPMMASDIPGVHVNGAVPAVQVVAHEGGAMPAPALYVPALNQPGHPMRRQAANGQWFELAQSVDLRHFGKIVDNRGSDIGPALRNFVDYAREKNGGTVMIPPGIFSLESPVDESINLPADNFGIGIFGMGTEISRIVVDGASVSHGPLFSAPNRAPFFQFEKFAILAEGRVNGRPLAATLPLNGGSRRNCSLIVRDLLVQGYDAHLSAGFPYDDHFTRGLDFTGAWRMLLENCHISGPLVPNVKQMNDWSDSSILWRMEDGLVIDGAYAPIIRDVQFYFVARPVLCRGHPDGPQDAGAIEAERGLFENVRCPTCKVAIEWFRTGAEPELVITDCFFDYRDIGLKIKGSRLGQIHRNAFFQKTNTDTSLAPPADIYLDHCIDFLIDHNMHHEGGDTRRVGIRMVDTSNAQGHVTDRIEIRRNRVTSLAVMSSYFEKGAGTGKAVYEPGAFLGSVSAEVDDSAATEKAALSLREPYSLFLTLEAPGQSLADNAWQTLGWSALERADTVAAEAWDTETPTRIIIPQNRAITRIRLRATVEFTAGGGGLRRMQVLRNGTPGKDLNIAVPAQAGAPAILSAGSDWIEVAGGDILELRVLQESGGALAATGATSLTASFR